MAYNFPNSPSNGDTVTVNGVVYTYISADNAWKTGTGQSPAILSDGSTPSLGGGITAAEIRTLIGAGTSSVDISSIAGDLIPDGNETRDLGSSTNRFKDLHLSGTSINLGNQTISADSSNIIVGQLKIGSGNSQVTLSGGANNTLQIGNSAAFSGAFSDLSGKPTTIAGYGITDAFDGVFASLSSKPTTIAGYGITDALTLGTTATTALAGNTALFSGAFSALTGKPTTIAGYGITDAFSGAFSALTGKPTTIAGYGITDAASTSADIDIGSNDFITTGKVYFANMFAQTSNLPSATTYHGMFAHVHNTGAAYFAHGGNWIELANKSYVDTQVTALVDSAPATLNTLNELAAALNDDASFSTTVTNSIATKAPLASPALTGIPSAPTASSGTNTTQLATTAFVQAAVSGAGSYNDAAVDTHLNTGTASTNEVLSWNGSDYDWVAQSGGGGGASVTTSDAAPSSPTAGDLWYNTNAGGLFVYYQDANSSQWVEIVGKTGATGATGAQGPAGSSAAITRYANVAGFPGSPTAADLAYANDTNTLYLYNGTSWEVVASGNDESPVITTEPPTSTQALSNSGSTSTVTMVAQDPEGFDITYGIAYKTANNALPSQLASAPSINQSTGVYTFTPSTNSAHAGNFRARLSASDGARTTTRLVDFSLAFTVPVEYLVIGGGGGGGGGSAAGGGGGAGGYLTATNYSLNPGQAYSITVGAGGAGTVSPDNDNASNGSNSVFGSITALGGGGGAGTGPASASYAGDGLAGGSGGGGRYGGNGGAGTSGQGNAGGASTNGGARGSGGGGGAGAAGTDGGTGTTAAGSGGAGLASSITGTSVTRAGGGGGATWNNQAYTNGGAGGGGNGGSSASAGTANTGGGGGGNGSSVAGQAGGSGVVIIAAQQAAATVTGTYTVDTSGRSGWHVYTFTAGTGSITF